MSPTNILRVIGAALALVALALLPRYADAYYLSLAISLLQFTVLATAWGMFSGPTRYVSLATTAFFGVGAYTVAVLGEVLAWPLVLLIAVAIGALMAVIVGISTLRLSGLHFVIFTFGLGVVEGLTKVFYPEASNTVIFVIMVLVLLVKPAGLFGRAQR